MNGKAPASGLKGYLGALVATILFPLVWMRAMRLARRHKDADARGPAKVALAIVLGVVIAAGGAFVMLKFQDTATAGMYDSMETRLSTTVGEAEYQGNAEAIKTATGAIPKVERSIANETAKDPVNAQKVSDLRAVLNKTRDQLTKAQANVTKFEPNHQLFLDLQPHLDDQDDAAIRQEIADADLAYPEGMSEGAESAIAIKDDAVSDMHLSMWLFVWPSLAAMFFAPLAFALGSILRNVFTESDTVGFKPYPGAAAGLFLLFGAFGLPGIPFAAWVFMDAENRSVEGQIAL